MAVCLSENLLPSIWTKNKDLSQRQFEKTYSFREGGDISLYITLVPKVSKKFLFIGLTTLGILIGWFIKLSV